MGDVLLYETSSALHHVMVPHYACPGGRLDKLRHLTRWRRSIQSPDTHSLCPNSLNPDALDPTSLNPDSLDLPL
jgi:hypothetical protein